MKPDEIREAFLRFFEERGHRRMPGAPLVPPGDPTLLFTSAGMVQFKAYFMGQAKAPHPRLATVQKCFRTSDIDSVGDASHLTFFEMLGNFSVGDYFKAEAIPWAWEFVTAEQWLGLDPDRLWVAVYLDDDEAFELWRRFLPAERIRRYGEEHNYWFSGEVGPCGPCSELHYDFGPQFGCGPRCEPDHEGCDRFLEIWNLVFMSFFCDGDKRDPLPSTNIDTGAGLERMAVASLFESGEWKDKSKLPSVYDTDLFAPIIKRIEKLSGKRYRKDEATDRAMRIVAEHARAVTFLIGDERTPAIPSNEERGYAVRRVLRRAVYFGRRYLGLEQPFLTDVAETAIQGMSGAYPELEGQRKFVLDILGPEEQRFEETLSRGLEMLEEHILPARQRRRKSIRQAQKDLRQHLGEPTSALPKALQRRLWSLRDEPAVLDPAIGKSAMWRAAWLSMNAPINEFLDSMVLLAEDNLAKHSRHLFKELDRAALTLSGEETFILHDTYGLPMELTREIARERGFSVDEAGFEAEMEKQRERARAAAKGDFQAWLQEVYAVVRERGHHHAMFVGYETLEAVTSVDALVRNGHLVDEASEGSTVEVLLDETPFYAEGGGQVGDKGRLFGPKGIFQVEDTQSAGEGVILHRGRVVEGRIAAGEAVTARVDAQHREDTMRNHTGTHLLHAALRRVLGSHVRQSGSLVALDRLRFDFTHTEALTEEQIAEVQRLVNEKIRLDLPVETRLTTYDQAMAEGVVAFFGEKYGEEVRVVEVNSIVPKFSAELCGGTHCHRTGEIGMLIISGESSIGAGMRRIEALTGRGAEEYVRAQDAALDDIGRLLAAPRDVVPAKVEALLAELDAQRKMVERLERSLARGTAPAAGKRETLTIDGVSVSAAEVEATSQQALRFMGDALRRELAGQSGRGAAAVIGAVIDDKPSFVAVASKDAGSRGLTADALVREVARVAGGGGGGRPDMATGGGKDPAKLAEALKQVPDIARKLLTKG